MLAAWERDGPDRLVVREPAVGLSHARNRALAASTRDVVLFTDDDALVTPCWAARPPRRVRRPAGRLVGRAGRVGVAVRAAGVDDRRADPVVRRARPRRRVLRLPERPRAVRREHVGAPRRRARRRRLRHPARPDRRAVAVGRGARPPPPAARRRHARHVRAGGRARPPRDGRSAPTGAGCCAAGGRRASRTPGSTCSPSSRRGSIGCAGRPANWATPGAAGPGGAPAPTVRRSWPPWPGSPPTPPHGLELLRLAARSWVGQPVSPLSVCCLTNDRPAVVAAMLAMFRPVADEIVVAVDQPRRSDAARAARSTSPTRSCASSTTPRRSGPGRGSSRRAPTPTVLMIDGDEVPSQALLAALPGPPGRRRRRAVPPGQAVALPRRADLAGRATVVPRPPAPPRPARAAPRLRPALPRWRPRRVAVPLRDGADLPPGVRRRARSADRRRVAREYDAAPPGTRRRRRRADERHAVRPRALRHAAAGTDSARRRRRHPRRAPAPPTDRATTATDVPLVGVAEIDRHHPADPLEAPGLPRRAAHRRGRPAHRPGQRHPRPRRGPQHRRDDDPRMPTWWVRRSGSRPAARVPGRRMVGPHTAAVRRPAGPAPRRRGDRPRPRSNRARYTRGGRSSSTSTPGWFGACTTAELAVATRWGRYAL